MRFRSPISQPLFNYYNAPLPPESNINWDEALANFELNPEQTTLGQENPLTFQFASQEPVIPPNDPERFQFSDLLNADTFNSLGSLAKGIGGIWGAWNGMNQLGLQKDAFDFSKQMALKNYRNQVKTTNNAMRERQQALYGFHGGASNPNNAYQDPDSYMKENGLKGGKKKKATL